MKGQVWDVPVDGKGAIMELAGDSLANVGKLPVLKEKETMTL